MNEDLADLEERMKTVIIKDGVLKTIWKHDTWTRNKASELARYETGKVVESIKKDYGLNDQEFLDGVLGIDRTLLKLGNPLLKEGTVSAEEGKERFQKADLSGMLMQVYGGSMVRAFLDFYHHHQAPAVREMAQQIQPYQFKNLNRKD